MSGTDQTFHVTKEDIRKPEKQAAGQHGGKVPKDSDIAQMQSVIDQQTDKKADIERRKANLPLPDDPPVPSDFNSMNQDTVNVGSGGISSDISTGDGASSLREPATGPSSVRTSGEEWKTHTAPGPNVGRQGKEGLGDLPKDALAREYR